jgi:hypothetical protein
MDRCNSHGSDGLFFFPLTHYYLAQFLGFSYGLADDSFNLVRCNSKFLCNDQIRVRQVTHDI